MNYEHEKGIKAMKLCLNMHPLKNKELEYLGLTCEDISQIHNGEKYFSEEQLLKFALVTRPFNMLNRPLADWLDSAGLWALAGITEPAFSINGNPIRAFMDLPYVYINNPELLISIEDIITHTYSNGHKEKLFIEDIDYNPYSRGYKPIYKLTVSRSKQSNMQNTLNVGGNINMSGNSNFNSGNVIEVQELPADLFEQTRALLAEINEEHRLALENMLAKIEAAHASGNKKECGNWFGKFFSLASIADCITVAQPLLHIISWLMANA